jgi:dipeptidyl aminopeptidase/acylaminoacyl peptidase
LFIYEGVTKTGRWLESRDLFGGSRVALTSRPAPGEIRRDCCASWSPDGTAVAFFRRTPKLAGLFLVAADGSHLHQLVAFTQLRGIAKPGLRAPILWASDGSKLLFTAGSLKSSCNDDAIYRVNIDGSDFRPLWRRPPSLRASVSVLGWSPDGSRALFDLSRNDGDCYGSHIGPETLMLVTDEIPRQTVKLVTASTFGGASWSPDGSQIAYAVCEYAGAPCNISVLDANTGQTRLLTHFTTYTSPYMGFDELPFLWSGRSELVLGRFLSLFALDATGGQMRRIVTAPCPQPSGHCPHRQITLYGISLDGSVVFDANDVGCTFCSAPSYRPKPASRRYVFESANNKLVPLPDPNLPVDDTHFP